ncbi:MAG: hypothetical protein MJ187_00205 [Alphaproteobacteria bacterium]|nr:hypothetical protein [Alphaproteobacteria bacterium]
MKNDSTDMQVHMLSKQRVLFRAFFINLILGLIVWCLTFIPSFVYMAVIISGISPITMYCAMIAGIALWQMLGIIMFLVPAISLWCERRVLFK